MRLLETYPHVMELKDYQRRVLEELEDYANGVSQLFGVGAIHNPAAVAFTDRTGKPCQPLTHDPLAPFVCLKVPTGGGKTLLAAHAASLIYNALLQDKDDTGIILWLTPSDAIRSQTLRALKDPNHPYRRVLESSFSTTVHVLDNQEALRIRPDQVRDGVSVIVSTMQSMKREDKEGLKAYEDNGYLQAHFTSEDEQAGVRFSLFEVIRRSRPLIVADEGHNAKTVLALDLIESLKPSFVLELTLRAQLPNKLTARHISTHLPEAYSPDLVEYDLLGGSLIRGMYQAFFDGIMFRAVPAVSAGVSRTFR